MRLSAPFLSSRLPEASPSARVPPPPALLALNRRRLRENARVLALLGTASTLGAAAGVLGVRAPVRRRGHAFFQAATGVHLFVLGTALAGARAIRAQRLPGLGWRVTLRRSRLLQRLLGVGLGLDVASAALGALLLGRRGRSGWREGAGASLLLHGGALLLFDAAVFRRNAQYHHQVEAFGRTSSGQVLRVVHA
jgi:hypothetical protein